MKKSFFLLALLLLAACVSQNPVLTTEDLTSPTKILPTKIPTPTAEFFRNYPSPFYGLYYGPSDESGSTSITILIDGAGFEKNNPDCTVPTVAGVHEIRINSFINPKTPDQEIGFSIESDYLRKYFSAQTDESGKISGRMPDGTGVELVDNIWRMKNGEKYLFFIPIVPYSVDKPFGYPVICEKKGKLMMTLVDKNGVVVDGVTLEAAFRKPVDIAIEMGLDYKPFRDMLSVSLTPYGKLLIYSKTHRTEDLLEHGFPYLSTSFSPDYTAGMVAGIVPFMVDGVSIDPVFDVNLKTWVWKNTNGEVRRILDPKTGHIFAQTKSSYGNLIYQVDIEFGWEADFTEVDASFNGEYSQIGYDYLWDLKNHFPNVFSRPIDNSKLVFKIVHGYYEDIVDKTSFSSSKDPGNPDTGIDFLWPAFDEKNNVYTLTAYLHFDYLGIEYSPTLFLRYMLNYCPTTTPESILGTRGGAITRKSIR